MTRWHGTFAQYLVTWLCFGFTMPFIWSLSLNQTVLGWVMHRIPLEIGYVVFMIEWLLWPSSLLLWDMRTPLPELFGWEVFWISVAENVVAYVILGLGFWLTRHRMGWGPSLWRLIMIAGVWLASVCVFLWLEKTWPVGIQYVRPSH